MSHPGFFDLENRHASLAANENPLVVFNMAVPFTPLRVKLNSVQIEGPLRSSDADHKSATGRKPRDMVPIFKVLLLQALYNLSDEAMEYQLRNRLQLMRFVGFGLDDAVPEAKTLWLFQEALAKAVAPQQLLGLFDDHLKAKGYLSMGGQIIDAIIVAAPGQRNSREDKARMRAGKTSEHDEKQPTKNCQKDKGARNGKSYFGYKKHIRVDRVHRLVRCYGVISASGHDSQEQEAKLAECGFKSLIQQRRRCGKPLTARQHAVSKTCSSARTRVEHLFGSQHTNMGSKLLRTVGAVRKTANIRLINLKFIPNQGKNPKLPVTMERWT